jgi:predicted membrane-bound mannosyltransferase/sugar lactone lactonase YvrE
MEASHDINHSSPESKPSWLDKPVQNVVTLNWETVLFFTILILAISSRFFDLGTRVMSHDETSHVYFSWLFEQGSGYSHDPVTHGPLQFHLVAFSYFIFGDSDFSARIPAALFSIATVIFMWNYRRYLGRAGAIIAALLLLISPYLLYYGRYVRNEAFVALFGVITIWALLRYLESRQARYLYWLTAASALHFTTKETAFIYTAQVLLFLAIYLVFKLLQRTWSQPEFRQRFIIALVLAVILLGLAVGLFFSSPSTQDISATEVASPSVPGEEIEETGFQTPPLLPSILFIFGGIILIVSLYFLIRGYTWNLLRAEPSFGILVVLGTLTLPMLAPFPVKFLGYNPIDYQTTINIIITAGFVIFFTIIAIALGLLWNPKLWLINMAIFYAIFIVLYTSIFTNGFGFYTGIVGSLGYWLEQQGVERGSQPWYYYSFLQVPFYEYLPALGSILAIIFAPKLLKSTPNDDDEDPDDNSDVELENGPPTNTSRTISTLGMQATTVALLSFWTITSLIAYTYAGEKMPWLTVHIAWPMILLTAWFLGKLVETTNWSDFRSQRGVLVVLLLPIFFISTSAALGALLGPNPPFQGKELIQLQSSTTFVTSLLIAVISGWGIYYLVKSWSSAQLIRIITLTIFGLLGLLTIRTSIRAAYIHYDNATEYLVYAHMARGPKEALAQIEEISRRTTDGLAIRVAYDDETTYPYWWYLRNFTNKDYFGANPTRSQRDAAVILVGEKNYGKIEPVVGQAYNQFDYVRIWWPNQDYFGLTPQRIFDALTNPQMRAALFDIWMNRDYTLYSQITEQDFSLPNWQPSQKFRLYIRKDIIGSMWNYGTSPAPESIVADPYEGKQLDWLADNIIGELGSDPGQFQRQRDLAVATDGSIYIADTENHRIQHIAEDGTVLHVWGGFGASSESEAAPVGKFNEPWGIALGTDDTVYVADTWNHRIQQFTPEGEFINTWGYGISQNDDPYGFYGPRDVAVNSNGDVFVTDTGNKRIVVFDRNGTYISQFGEAGFGLGQFDEPVGISIDPEGMLYVADTWNQRIQVFTPGEDGAYSPLTSWDVVAWYGQTLDNKPYIDIDNVGNLYAADPEGYRILKFTTEGDFQYFWGDYSTGPDGFGLAGSVAVDPDGNLWVSDTGNNRLMHFSQDQSLELIPVE